MNEDLLSFIWQFQYFDKANLQTDGGDSVQIIRTGKKNTNAGPDFSNARVRIEGIEWVGSIEIHTRSSDWKLHQHSTDDAYESVILHVVWENDIPIFRPDNTLLPVLALKGLVRLSILERYTNLMNAQNFYDSAIIPCQEQFTLVDELQKFSMLDRVLMERLDKKASKVLELYYANQQDWEETAYQWLGQHFGFKLNDPAFLRLTQIVPLKILQKHRTSPAQVEALLFGLAGLIPDKEENENPEDAYLTQLRREYQFLSLKYRIGDLQMNAHEFKFLRLRPAGFPTIRISQFADLIIKNGALFSSLTSAQNLKKLHKIFTISQSDYWTRHFQFGKPSKSTVPAMGKDAANLLIINAAVPLMVAYAGQRQETGLLDIALALLNELPAENNKITRAWEILGMKVKTAADSQSLIQWHNQYCVNKKCLECVVGAALVRST